jgi:hypothetical protein
VGTTERVQRRRRLDFDVVEPRELTALTVAQYPLPAPTLAPASHAFAPNGNLWFVEAARREAIGRRAGGSHDVPSPFVSVAYEPPGDAS